MSSLVATKRTLPVCLRNSVAPVEISDDVLPLIPPPGIAKVIKHRNQPAIVVDVHPDIRQLLVDGVRFWIPRRSSSRKSLRAERVKRQYTSGVRLGSPRISYTGEPRPDRDTVAIEDIYRELEEQTIRLLNNLGKPENRLATTASKESRLMSVMTRLDNLKGYLQALLRAKMKEFMENLTIEVLRRSKMSDQKIHAVYDVVCGGTAVETAANSRGLDVGWLTRRVRSVRAEVRPQLEKELRVWAEGEEEVTEAAQDTASLHEEKSVLVCVPPNVLRAEQISVIR